MKPEGSLQFLEEPFHIISLTYDKNCIRTIVRGSAEVFDFLTVLDELQIM
jgi:hypothetical protein